MISFAERADVVLREMEAAKISTWLRILRSPMSTAEEEEEAIDKLEESLKMWRRYRWSSTRLGKVS